MSLTEQEKGRLIDRALDWDFNPRQIACWKREHLNPKPTKGPAPSPPRWGSLRTISKLIQIHAGKCYWCGRLCNPKLSPNADLFPTKDHLVRRADGGGNGMHNLVLACRKCNNTRHGKDWKPHDQR